MTAAIGTPAPKVDTLRGRIGAALMTGIGRALWWYTERIQNTFTALARRVQQLAGGQGRVNELVLDSQAELAGAIESLRAEIAGLRAALEATRRWVDGAQPVNPELYVAFEAAFRGPREEIKKRQSAYLHFFADRKHLYSLPAIDIGCGRGEWLELLGEQGVAARGVDINPAMIDICRKLGLAVEQGDGLEYLKAQPDASAGILTAFHVIEHLPFAEVLELIAQSLRVLAPGGVLILETPNPANVTVGSHYFYGDPTHRKPVPCDMLKFFVEAIGFPEVYALALHPDSEMLHVPGEEPVVRRFNEVFYGPRDYGVIGRKAMPASRQN